MARFHLPKKKCKQVVSKRRVAKGSQRWIKRGQTYLLIACPAGKWNKKTERCKVGTFAVEKVKAQSGSSCPAGFKKSGAASTKRAAPKRKATTKQPRAPRRQRRGGGGWSEKQFYQHDLIRDFFSIM